MKWRITLCRLGISGAMAVSVVSCAPFAALSSGSGVGTCSTGTVAAQTGDSGSAFQQQINYSASVAQSVVLQPNQSLSSVALRLEGHSATTPSSLSGTLTVFVVPDQSGTGTPSQPSCGPSAGASACAGQAAAIGTLDMSTISVLAPEWYNISFGGETQVSSPSAIAVWIVVTSSNSSGGSNYVSWDGAPSIGNPNFLTLLTVTNLGISNWTSSTQNMTFEVCQ